MSVATLSIMPWTPPRLGLPKALLIAMAGEALLIVLLLWPWHHAPAPPPAMPQQVTTVDFVELPPPAPVVPKPVPKWVLPPLPKPDIVIPKKVKPRPRPIHHVIHKPKPAPKPHPMPHSQPKPVSEPHPAPQVIKAPLSAPRVALVSGPSPSAVDAYAKALHTLIQNNVVVGAMIQQLGLSGSVRVSFTLGPQGGYVRDLQVFSGGSNPLIRQAALKTVGQLRYPPFPKSFGSAPRHFEVTVQINSGN